MNTKILKNQVCFVRSFVSLQGNSLRPSEVVQVVRRAMDDWQTTPQGSKRTTKTGKNVKSETKNMKNKANFKDVYLAATSYNERVYNVSQPKPKNGTKPI